MRQYSTVPRLYVPDDLHTGQSVDLPQTQAHYLGTVMRMNLGAKIRVFNAKHGEYLAKITNIAKRRASIRITEHLRTSKAAPDIWLMFAPLKKNRTSFIIEKATELGAGQIQPVITARTTSRIRIDKAKTHIIEAAEQTERLDLPQIREPIKLDTLLQNWDDKRVLIFADEESGRSDASATHVLGAIKAPAAILIGPEGGFTLDERVVLKSKPFVKTINLGPRILRADTAALATLALWQALSGDW